MTRPDRESLAPRAAARGASFGNCWRLIVGGGRPAAQNRYPPPLVRLTGTSESRPTGCRRSPAPGGAALVRAAAALLVPDSAASAAGRRRSLPARDGDRRRHRHPRRRRHRGARRRRAGGPRRERGRPTGGGAGPRAAGAAEVAEVKTDSEIDEEVAKRTAVIRVKLGLAAVLGTPAKILWSPSPSISSAATSAASRR